MRNRLLWLLHLALGGCASSKIDRRKIVESCNPHRNASSSTTPLQVGNGNFAFGVDVTGLQTFRPFATMSTWGWHNFSLPTTEGQTSIEGELQSYIICSLLPAIPYGKVGGEGEENERGLL